MSPPHVLIIGGGLGGLVLAQGLRKNGISFTVFERDISPTIRAQGYRVRIASGGPGGADALRECLDDKLWDLFETTCAEIKTIGPTRLNAIDGSALPFIGPPGALRGRMLGDKAYTVDRTMLRSLLVLDQEDHIQFGKTFHRYELTTSGVKVFFEDGTTEAGTLLVGADGVASRVRKQFLPSQRYVDTGSRVIYGKTPITPELTAALPAEAMQWTTIIRDEKPLNLFLEPIRFPKDASIESAGRLARTDDYIYWVFGGSAEHFNMSDEEFHSLSGKDAADLTLKVTEEWKSGFRALFELQNTENTSPLRLISAKPERPDWAPSARVSLLGDAVHAMMPAGGSGANAALRDAASLTKLIVEQGISEKMMEIYIDQLWARALPLISGSAMGGEKLLGFKGFAQAKEIEL